MIIITNGVCTLYITLPTDFKSKLYKIKNPVADKTLHPSEIDRTLM